MFLVNFTFSSIVHPFTAISPAPGPDIEGEPSK